MPHHPDLPGWQFGDVLAYDDSTEDPDSKVRAMFVCWGAIDDIPDYSSSVMALVILTETPRWPNSHVGDIARPYAGWWKDAPE